MRKHKGGMQLCPPTNLSLPLLLSTTKYTLYFSKNNELKKKYIQRPKKPKKTSHTIRKANAIFQV